MAIRSRSNELWSGGEAQTIAHKLGISFRVELEKRIAGAEKAGKRKTSMLQDAEAGRARIVGVQVQQMLTGGQELIIGAVTDPSFGKLVAFGLGGPEGHYLPPGAGLTRGSRSLRWAPSSSYRICTSL